MHVDLQNTEQSLFQDRYRVAAQAKVRGILQRVQQQHLFCSLLFAQAEHSFSSVLVPGAEAEALLFDLPIDFPEGLVLPAEVTVLVRLEGVMTGFRSQCLGRSQDLLRVAIPEALYQLQRRQLYRVPPAISDPDEVRIQRRSAGTLVGHMQDISIGGQRILLRQVPPGPLPRVGDVLPEISFALRDSPPIMVAASVCFASAVQADALMLGVCFLDLPRPSADLIAQYVQTRDREILQVLGIGLPGSSGIVKKQKSSLLWRWWRGS